MGLGTYEDWGHIQGRGRNTGLSTEGDRGQSRGRGTYRDGREIEDLVHTGINTETGDTHEDMGHTQGRRTNTGTGDTDTDKGETQRRWIFTGTRDTDGDWGHLWGRGTNTGLGTYGDGG